MPSEGGVMDRIEGEARAMLVALFEAKLQAAMPTLRASAIMSKPVRVFHNNWAPLIIGALAPHDTVSWFPVPGLRSHAGDYGVAVNGLLIAWRSRVNGGGYYYYSRAVELLSDDELRKAIAALSEPH